MHSPAEVWKSLMKKSQNAVAVGRIKIWETVSLYLISVFHMAPCHSCMNYFL